jgi:hypothetical protein
LHRPSGEVGKFGVDLFEEPGNHARQIYGHAREPLRQINLQIVI